MSYFLEVKNRAISSLASDVTDVATTWTLATGEGAKFPTSGDFHVTCEDEIVKVTARTTDTLTVTRAQEGTTGAAHSAGKPVELRITAGIITEIQGKKAIAGWTVDKLLKGAGAGADPTEIDVPSGTYGYYTGDSSVNRAIPHGLGVIPTAVFLFHGTNYMYRILRGVAVIVHINATAYGNLSVTAPDSTNFYVGNSSDYSQSANLLNEAFFWVAIR